jgi:hypothetical protein
MTTTSFGGFAGRAGAAVAKITVIPAKAGIHEHKLLRISTSVFMDPGSGDPINVLL